MRIAVLLSAAALAVWAVPSRAGDAGDLVFPSDVDGKARGELIYEHIQRGLDVDGTAVDFEADQYLIRAHTAVGANAMLDFDLGAVDAGGELGFIGGVGLRYLAYDAASWRLGAFAQARYALEHDVEVDGETVDADLIEGDAGLLLAAKIDTDQILIRPYIGPAVSILRVGGDLDGEEDSLFGGVGGVQLLFGGENGLRFEGQYFDDFSVSVAASIAF